MKWISANIKCHFSDPFALIFRRFHSIKKKKETKFSSFLLVFNEKSCDSEKLLYSHSNEMMEWKGPVLFLRASAVILTLLYCFLANAERKLKLNIQRKIFYILIASNASEFFSVFYILKTTRMNILYTVIAMNNVNERGLRNKKIFLPHFLSFFFLLLFCFLLFFFFDIMYFICKYSNYICILCYVHTLTSRAQSIRWGHCVRIQNSRIAFIVPLKRSWNEKFVFFRFFLPSKSFRRITNFSIETTYRMSILLCVASCRWREKERKVSVSTLAMASNTTLTISIVRWRWCAGNHECALPFHLRDITSDSVRR